MLNDPYSRIVISSEARNLWSFEAQGFTFSHMCCALLRFLHLFFMPLEPYPVRYARHLPHEGKALSVVILFPHMRVFALMLWGKRFSRIVAFPIGEGGPRQRCSGTFVNGALETHFPTRFYTASALSAPSGHRKAIHTRGEADTSFLIPHSGRAFIPDQGAAHPTG